MTLKKRNAVRAGQLRSLARDYERGAISGFTCISVGDVLGADVRRDYAEAFGFSNGSSVVTPADDALWSMQPEDRLNTRILLLCFAAAMAEAGDL